MGFRQHLGSILRRRRIICDGSKKCIFECSLSLCGKYAGIGSQQVGLERGRHRDSFLWAASLMENIDREEIMDDFLIN